MTAQENKKNRNKLASYVPYPKLREFHNLSATHRERMLLGSNQSGKTYGGAFEMAIHLTGRYPDWWKGRRFEGPIEAIAGSVSQELTRKGMQRLLIGPPENRKEWGTGAIPAECLGEFTRKSGVANCIDSIVIKHVSGGNSVLQFASYVQVRENWQASTSSIIWFDEEPPEDVYFEGITRTNVKSGLIMLTFTPLMGRSAVVNRFYTKPTAPTCAFVQMGIKDALHYTPQQIEEMMEIYPAHERDARLWGIPQFGSGLVISFPEEQYTCEPFQIPKHWAILGGIDFGWDHPTACVKIAWDRDEDKVYVVACHRARENTPLMIAQAVKSWGDIPWFWPHDGLAHDKGSGIVLAEQYRKVGMDMWHEKVSHPQGGNSVEAGITQILDLLRTGRLKIFRTCFELLEEMKQYHRKNGLLVKEKDDAISAMRYGLMMLRYARAPKEKIPEWRKRADSKGSSKRSQW